MINITDTFLTLLPIPSDAKLCNWTYSGSNIIIETLAEYKTRVYEDIRIPGMIVSILLPKDGYTLLASYAMSTFADVLFNFDFKYYTYKDGVADINFEELLFGSLSDFVLKDGDKVLSDNNFSDADKAKLDELENVKKISLTASSSIAGKIVGATFPSGWSLAPSGDLGTNLLITHNLVNRELAEVTVKYVDGLTKRLRTPFKTAFSGVIEVGQTITIEGLDPVELPLIVHLFFS